MNITVKSNKGDETTLSIKGKGVDHSTVNTLRRIILTEIATYAAPVENIEIEKNTTITNNDQLRLRMSLITIPNIQNDVVLFHEDEKYEQDTIEMYIDVTNDTSDVLNVTTNHIKLFINGQEIKNKFNKNEQMLIVKLRPNEVVKLHAVAVLGKAYINNIWSAVGPCYYNKLGDNNYELYLTTLGQLSNKEILDRTYKIIKEKLENIKVLVGDKYNNSSVKQTKKILINLQNEDHTMGNLITTALQNDDNVLYAGYKKDHPLIDEIDIKLETKSNDPLKTFFKRIDYLKSLFS